jgi:hypothetical protein
MMRGRPARFPRIYYKALEVFDGADAVQRRHPAIGGVLHHSWRSNLNPELATLTFYITFTALVLVAWRPWLSCSPRGCRAAWGRSRPTMFALEIDTRHCLCCGICTDVCLPRAIAPRPARAPGIEGCVTYDRLAPRARPPRWSASYSPEVAVRTWPA